MPPCFRQGGVGLAEGLLAALKWMESKDVGAVFVVLHGCH